MRMYKKAGYRLRRDVEPGRRAADQAARRPLTPSAGGRLLDPDVRGPDFPVRRAVADLPLVHAGRTDRPEHRPRGIRVGLLPQGEPTPPATTARTTRTITRFRG